MSNYDQRGPDLRDQFQQDYRAQQNQLAQQKTKKRVWLIGALVLAAILLMGGCGTYNGLVGKRQAVKNEFSNVDVQLQRRADLIPNLVNTVKGYTQHEEKVFSDIADARSRLLNAKTVDEKADANAQVSSALGRLLVLSENYPNLKADQQFLRLQDELSGTENRIAVARRDYNTKVLDYNTSRQRFPSVIFANVMGFQAEPEFKADPGSREAPKVEFPTGK
ncbi:MAG TPA: LemA family protein [Blastocatellia bacterium]|nr:LemA family protein [Blastocatellia bacterium]